MFNPFYKLESCFSIEGLRMLGNDLPEGHFDNKKPIDIELKGFCLTIYIVSYGLGRHYLYKMANHYLVCLVPGIFLLGEKK